MGCHLGIDSHSPSHSGTLCRKMAKEEIAFENCTEILKRLFWILTYEIAYSSYLMLSFMSDQELGPPRKKIHSGWSCQ